ncbi:MAG: hypothetical protein ACFFAU_18800 [Candidatus Hodarchaeota archaeon]
MTKRREMVRNFIKTILETFPKYIAKYSTEDQQLLNEFKDLVEICDKEAERFELEPKLELESPRVALSKKIEFYLSRWRNNEKYLLKPFLWFITSFFTYANLVLSVSSFHSDEFFEYLLQYLRGDSKVKGAFQLVREKTSLSNIVWEQLQYACVRIFPLSNEEVDVLETITSDIPKSGIEALNQNRIKRLINNRLIYPNKRVKIANFFKLLECRWNLWFNNPSFDIVDICFNIKLKGETKSSHFTNLINVESPRNTTFASSRIYRVRGEDNTYVGLILVPFQAVNSLMTYLQMLEQQERIILKDLSLVTNQQLSTSMNLYKMGKGWINIGISQWNRIVTSIRNPSLRESEKYFFLTYPFQNWNYRDHKLNSQFIRLFCHPLDSFSYEELPFKNARQEKSIFNQIETGLMKLLIKKRALGINFIPARLHLEFSLDFYWITLEKEKEEKDSLDKLLPFLEILPYCRILNTKFKIHFWTLLPKKIAKWIERDLNWRSIPILPYYVPKRPNISWYDFDNLNWRIPEDIVSF